MTRRVLRRRAVAGVVVGACALGACGGDGPDAATTVEPTTTVETTTAVETNSTVETTAAVEATSTVPATEWRSYRIDDPLCACADGSEYWYHVLERDPEHVLLYFQGGGACFSEQMCRFTDGTYKPSTGPDDHPQDGDGGIWNAANAANPFRDWSVVFVPYCSGDVFLGDTETTYGDDLTVQHRGARHARKGLDHVVAEYPDLTELFVTGSSAGGVPTPLIGGLAADLLPDTRITVLADSSGGYPSNPGVNGFIGSLWGTDRNIPDWPELERVPADRIGIPDLFTYAGLHDPAVAMARYDTAFDAVQEFFSSLADLDGGLPAVLDANQAAIEAAGVGLDVFVAPGTEHTILGNDALYELEVDGTAFIDWLTALVNGESPGDVHCTDCGAPASDPAG